MKVNSKPFFTGNASPLILNRLLNQPEIKSNLLKIPHNGSKNGLIKEFLKLADPATRVISVGKSNSHGYPAKEILETLKAQNIIIKRIDLIGDIVFKTTIRNYILRIRNLRKQNASYFFKYIISFKTYPILSN